jgi:cupin fold WbuC family metalloprotein
MQIFDREILARLSVEADELPRKRKNLNIHPSDGFCCHRFFNAIQPGSYIRPHRHLDPNKGETIMIVSGALGVITFQNDGSRESSVILTAGGPSVAVDIPSGRFHTAVSLAHGTIFFEVKAGPYLPLTPDELPPWAPAEGSPDTAAYLAQLTASLVE